MIPPGTWWLEALDGIFPYMDMESEVGDESLALQVAMCVVTLLIEADVDKFHESWSLALDQAKIEAKKIVKFSGPDGSPVFKEGRPVPEKCKMYFVACTEQHNPFTF